MSFFCPVCSHATLNHSELVGCLACRCHLVRQGDFCVNPKRLETEPTEDEAREEQPELCEKELAAQTVMSWADPVKEDGLYD